MPTYEFCCQKCLKKGKLTEWEMQFGMSETKKSFCPVCGAVGTQVIRTAPAIAIGMKQRKLADALTQDELERRGASNWTPPAQLTEEDKIELAHIAQHEEPAPRVVAPTPPVNPVHDDFKPRPIQVNGDILAQGQAASAAQRRVNGAKTGLAALPKTLPTDAITVKGEARVQPTRGVFKREVTQ